MHHLPSDFQASDFVGREVSIVSFAEFSLYINFGDDVVVTVLHSLVLDGNVETIPPARSDLISLIGKKVFACHSDSDDSIEFVFENGRRLMIVNARDNYESYSIAMMGREIVV